MRNGRPWPGLGKSARRAQAWGNGQTGQLPPEATVTLAAEREAADIDSVLVGLDRDLAGLEPVKKRIPEVAALLLVDRARQRFGLSAPRPSLHMCFTGAPGAGKATVALRMAELLRRLGYLQQGQLVHAMRNDLVGEYIRQTAPKTKRVLDRAMGAGMPEAGVRRARNAVYAVFLASGFAFASWASRIPQVRDELRATPGELGLVLLCAAVGAGLGTLLAGPIVNRFGEVRTVAVMSVASSAGLAAVAVGHRTGVAAGLFVFGLGGGAWDVAMNVQGAAVERALGRAILPRFHAGWSVGTVAGAGVGAVMVALGVPVAAHLLVVAAAVAVAAPAAARGFLPAAGAVEAGRAARHRGLSAWAERRTLLIGLFVLCMTVVEGTGNDWLSLAVVDGYHVPTAMGVSAFAMFLAAMTAGRWFGPWFIDRRGRVPVLRAGAVAAFAGLVLIVVSGFLPLALAGAALMGLGTSLGFPVGLSAAADDPRYAAGRVSTAASIGYVAFLAGPPAVGFLSDRVGVLRGLSLAAAVLIVSFALVGATAPIGAPDGPSAIS